MEEGVPLNDGKERPRVAVLGMGKMGQALAGRLLDQGWSVVIWNRSPKDVSALEARGALRLDALATVWEHAGIVITFLANDDALANVCLDHDGVLSSGSPRGILIDMSTVSPRISTEVAARAAAVGVDYLRSPVSGNPAVLSSGNITLLVSGPRDTFERVEELMNSIGPTVLYVGDAEQSRTLKLAINSGLAATAQITGVLLVFALLVAPAAAAQQLTAKIGLGIGLSVGIALLVTWLGLGLAYYTNYSVGFYVSGLAFAVYLMARARRQFARRPDSSIQPAAAEVLA